MSESSNISFQSKSAILELQEQKLKAMMSYLHSNSPFYQKIFAEHGIKPGSIAKLSDLLKIPVTTKDHLQQYNSDFFCVSPSNIVEYTSTSGTLGKPVTVALTEHDLRRLALNEYNSFLCTGANESDIFQLMLTLDRQFMAGMAYYSGLRQLGAGIIRIGPGVPSLQWETIQRLQPTAIVAVPSFIVKLLQYAAEHKINPNESSVKKAICIGENIRNTDLTINVLGRRITDQWNIQLFSTYASTEMQTAFTECEAGQGGHLQPDLLIAELLDEENNPVAPGFPGEVTITTLDVEGMPLLRYKTGDICVAYMNPCSCGRQSLRLSPVIARKNQMIKYKGTTLFAPALFDLLNGMEDIKEYVAEVYANEIGTDELLLHLLPTKYSTEIDHKVRAYLQASLRVTPQINFISEIEMQQKQFPEANRKPIRFIDRR